MTKLASQTDYRGAPYINGSDLIKRHASLEQDRDNECLTEDETEELEALEEAIESISASSYLIHEDKLGEYAEDYAQNALGLKIDQWPLNYVDWDEAAEELRTDMTSVEFGEDTYYRRD